MKIYYTYIMSNRWKTVLYVGMTDDIRRRTHQHKTKFRKSFTQRYNCDRLVYYVEHITWLEAVKRERYIKRHLSREMKEGLINSMNPEWKDLSEGWYS